VISERMVERLSLYRHLLEEVPPARGGRLYSHELAAISGSTPAQVRRDLMTIGFTGSPARGYDVALLQQRIAELLDEPAGQAMALVGLGNLGRAIIAYFNGRRPRLSITAAFDNDEQKIHRVIHGCRCYPQAEMIDRVRELDIRAAIIAVPAAAAQKIAEQLLIAGVRAIVNYAPTPLALPPDIYVEQRDITYALEKAAYFARKGDIRKVS
jgi:redox-sensing transcriptional repressor